MSKIPIGLAIRNVRLNRYLTQQQVATRMNCPRPYVVKIESGTHSPCLTQFIRFADAMQIEPWVMLRYATWLSKAIQQPAVPQVTPPLAPEATT